MNGFRNATRRWRKGISWFRAGLLVLVGGLVALCFTGFPGKVKRGLRGMFAPKPVVVAPDEAAIRRQIEAKLRAEYQADNERKVDELERAAADKEAERDGEKVAKQVAEEPATRPDPAAETQVGSVMDVRKLRSGIPFKTEVKMEKGGIASARTGGRGQLHRVLSAHPAPARTGQDDGRIVNLQP